MRMVQIAIVMAGALAGCVTADGTPFFTTDGFYDGSNPGAVQRRESNDNEGD